MTIEEQAHQMTVKHYLSRGIFGGQRKRGGIIKYFNFEKTQAGYIKQLKEQAEKNVSASAKA